MKFRPIEELAENQRDLFLDDAGAVVLNANLVTICTGRFEMHPQLGDDAAFLAGIEGVIHGLLHSREQRLSGVVESKQMPVLRKELADGDIPLLRRHRLGGNATAAFFLGLCFGRWCLFRIFHNHRQVWSHRLTGQVPKRFSTPEACESKG